MDKSSLWSSNSGLGIYWSSTEKGSDSAYTKASNCNGKYAALQKLQQTVQQQQLYFQVLILFLSDTLAV